MAVDIGGALVDAKLAVAVAGALVVGICVAIKAFDWLRLVLIEREASKEYYDRYGS